MYLTYEEYQNMGGTLNEAAFNDFEFEAESIIDWYTFNRLHNQTTYPEALGKCVYALIKLCATKAGAMGLAENGNENDGTSAVIASQSNDGVSVSYNILSASEAFKLCSDEVGNTVKRYFNGVTNELGRKLLYRGLYPGE